MAAPKFTDKTGDYMSAFNDTFQRWMDPVNNPTVRFRDVEDARQDVIQHRSELGRRGLLPSQLEEKKEATEG